MIGNSTEEDMSAYSRRRFLTTTAGAAAGATAVSAIVKSPIAQANETNTRLVAAPTGKAEKDTPAIQAALNDGPGIVQLQSGTYICNKLTLPTEVILQGQGISATVVKLTSGANTSLLEGAEFEALAKRQEKKEEIEKGELYNKGIENGGFRDLTFDGNKENNKTVPGEPQGLIQLFGKAYVAERFYIQNAAGNGLFSAWGGGSSGSNMEAWLQTFKIIGSGKSGLVWRGPHDSHITNAQIIESGLYGVHMATDGNSVKFTNVHVWGGQTIGWLLESFGTHMYGCEGEGSTECNIRILESEVYILGGQYFGDGEPSTSKVGIKLGTKGKEVAECVIQTLLFGHKETALEIVGEDWHGVYILDVGPEEGKHELSWKEEELFKIATGGKLATNSTLIIRSRVEEFGAPNIYRLPINTKYNFSGGTAIEKPTVTGSKAGNAALASLVEQLAALGLIKNSTT
jgi:hypothetical protein